MATLYRKRVNAIGGVIEDNPLTSSATTLTSSALAAMPALGTDEYFVITLNPDGEGGVAPEIIYVTAHSAGATTATILRGQEGTTGTTFPQDTFWIHAPTAADYDGKGGGSGLIGFKRYAPGVGASTISTSSGSMADLDATNLVVTAIAPPSGMVLVKLSATADCSTAWMAWALRSGTTNLGNPQVAVVGTSQWGMKCVTVPILGLTPGTSYDLKWAAAVSAGHTGHIYLGDSGAGGSLILCEAVMEVWAVNV